MLTADAAQPKRVGIVVTGETEYYGISEAIQTLFPDHIFHCLPLEKTSLEGTSLCNGFTSVQLKPVHVQEPPEACQDLLALAAQEALGDGRRKQPYDLVVVLDDLELCNADQPELAVAVMKAAANKHLDVLAGERRRRTEQAFKERVSFHLIAPMIEAWFFIDDQALVRAGVQSIDSVVFDGNTDPEAFLTLDEDYQNAEASICTALSQQQARRKKKNKPKWLDNPQRSQHPKGYLQWLTRDPDRNKCTTYKESVHGANALKRLDWRKAIPYNPEHLRFIKSLIEDIEAGLGCDATIHLGVAPANHPTSIRKDARDLTLRNI